MPGPYLLTRAMFVPELTRAYYADKEALAQDVVALLRAELEELRSAGAEFVQFDEPVLTEVGRYGIGSPAETAEHCDSSWHPRCSLSITFERSR